jgi:hypothetical protein
MSHLTQYRFAFFGFQNTRALHCKVDAGVLLSLVLLEECVIPKLPFDLLTALAHPFFFGFDETAYGRR